MFEVVVSEVGSIEKRLRETKKGPEPVSDSGPLEVSRLMLSSLHSVLGPTRKVGKEETKVKLPAVIHACIMFTTALIGKRPLGELVMKFARLYCLAGDGGRILPAASGTLALAGETFERLSAAGIRIVNAVPMPTVLCTRILP